MYFNFGDRYPPSFSPTRVTSQFNLKDKFQRLDRTAASSLETETSLKACLTKKGIVARVLDSVAILLLGDRDGGGSAGRFVALKTHFEQWDRAGESPVPETPNGGQCVFPAPCTGSHGQKIQPNSTVIQSSSENP